MGHKFDLAIKNLVVLESQMLYTSIQPQSFHGSGEDKF